MQRLLSILTLFGLPLLAGAQTALYNNGATLQIQSGASLTIKGSLTNTASGNITNNATTQITGAISNNGTLTSTAGTIEMNGGTAQTIPANTFANNTLFGLKISNTAVTSAGALNITDNLSFGNVNNSTFHTSDLLTLKSTLAKTAVVKDVTNSGVNTGNTVAGNVIVERYISAASNRSFRLLAPSVNTTTSIKANWQENQNNTDASGYPNTGNSNTAPGYGTHITGSTTGANGFDATLSGEPSLYTYQYGSPDTYQAINNTNTNVLNAKTGYLLFIRGDRTVTNITASATSSNTTLRTTGTLVTGNVPYTLQSNGNFSLITNPYASSINWSTIYSDPANTGLENYYTYLDPNVGTRGGYVTVTGGGVRSINATGINGTVDIQSGQAFFVKSASTGTPALTIKETHKSTNNNVDVFRGGSPQQLSLTLVALAKDGSKRVVDGVNTVFNNSFSAGVDGNDAEEIANFDENLAITRAGKMLAIEGRPLVENADTIFLSVARLKEQGYGLQSNPVSFNAPGLQAYLQDKMDGTETPLSLFEPTLVSFAVTPDPASKAADRFRIIFKNSSLLPVKMANEKAYQKGTGIQVEWSMLTENNVDKYEVEKSVDGRQFTLAATQAAKGNSNSMINYNWLDARAAIGYNYFRIKTINKNGSAEFSDVLRVTIDSGNESMTISPNPVTSNQLTLQLTNFEKGRYTVVVTNTRGQQLYRTAIDHMGGSGSQTLHPNTTLPAGVYQLQLMKGSKKITQQFIKH